jgi:hypothetical protein
LAPDLSIVLSISQNNLIVKDSLSLFPARHMCAEEVVEFSTVPRVDEVHRFMEYTNSIQGWLALWRQ